MKGEARCRGCGCLLMGGVPDGLCPVCLLDAALIRGDSAASDCARSRVDDRLRSF